MTVTARAKFGAHSLFRATKEQLNNSSNVKNENAHMRFLLWCVPSVWNVGIALTCNGIGVMQ